MTSDLENYSHTLHKKILQAINSEVSADVPDKLIDN